MQSSTSQMKIYLDLLLQPFKTSDTMVRMRSTAKTGSLNHLVNQAYLYNYKDQN